MASSELGLVAYLSPELVKAHVQSRSRQATIAHHAPDVQILDGDFVEVLGQVEGQLVQGVEADTMNPVVKSRHLDSRLVTVFGTQLLPR